MVHEYADAHAFLEKAHTFLFSEELANNVLLSSVLTLARSARQPSLTFLAAGQPVQGAALRSPNHRWIVAAKNPDAAKALAEEIERREAKAKSRFVMIAKEQAEVFTAFPASQSQNLMVLKKLAPLANPSPGLLKTATTKHLKTLIQWSKAFADELALDESPQEAEDAIKRTVESKQLYVWENEGRLTAMTATGGFTPKAARLSMVYTDPSLRGQRYASTLVHRVSHKLQQDGLTPLLLADAANEKTKFIYESLGFKTIKEIAQLTPARGAGTKPARASRSPDSGRKPTNASR